MSGVILSSATGYQPICSLLLLLLLLLLLICVSCDFVCTHLTLDNLHTGMYINIVVTIPICTFLEY
jgi:hypothetical protein